MRSTNLSQKNLKTQLNEWKTEINTLKTESAGANAERKIAVNKQIRNLKAKVRLATRRQSENSASKIRQPGRLKTSAKNGWESLKSAVNESLAWLRK